MMGSFGGTKFAENLIPPTPNLSRKKIIILDDSYIS